MHAAPFKTPIWKTCDSIERDDPAAELIRQEYVEHLKSHIDTFYEHESFEDIAALCEAFDRLECREYSGRDARRARVVEELVAMAGKNRPRTAIFRRTAPAQFMAHFPGAIS